MSWTYYPELDERVFRETLPNGLDVVVIPRKGFSRKVAYFVTDFGSIHTKFTLDGESFQVPAGVAHYLEHKMFDLPGGRDVFAELAALGAFANAFTSYDMTAYYFSCTEQFEACLKLLLEFVSTPYFTQESVEKERGIIDQEIGMNEDAPDSKGFENLAEAMYQNHPVRVPILGNHESIRQITPEILELCHRAFYTPGNMLLCVMADVDPETVTTLAREMLGNAKKSVGQKETSWPEPMTCTQPLVRTQMEVAMPNFTLGFKCEPLGQGEAAIREEMLADLAAEALFGESSALYLRLYEQGLIDSSFGGGFETIDGCALLTCGGDSNQPEQVWDAIVTRAQELCCQGIPDTDFQRMKRSALGRRIKSLDSFDATCFRVCAYHFDAFDYFRFPEVYRAIDKKDVEAFLRRVVTKSRSCLSIIEPVRKENTP